MTHSFSSAQNTSGNVVELIRERDKTHGNYDHQAECAQRIKDFMRQQPNWERLPPVLRESLEMDATKTSRILWGNPFELDHWNDKAGYRQLVVDWICRHISSV